MMEARHDPILTPSAQRVELPDEFDARRLARRALWVIVLLGVVLLVVGLAPGLGKVRHHLAGASAPWLIAAVVLEGLSCISYVLLFRPVFCPRMSWRTSFEIGFAELGVGSIVPASGAGGLALGAWVLHRDGMPAAQIARRSVAFFLIKGSVNFAAVAITGTAMALGAGPHQSLALTALPAALAVAFMVFVVLLRRIGPGEPGGGKVRAARRALVDGITEALAIVRSRDALVIAGAIGYWAFDNAVLWATYRALGPAPPVTVVLMGYLIGQLGGLLPIPGGLGGIDGGLIGTLVVYGAPLASTTAAVLLYRVILFWLPLLCGAVAFVSLRRGLNQPQRPDLCQA